MEPNASDLGMRIAGRSCFVSRVDGRFPLDLAAGMRFVIIPQMSEGCPGIVVRQLDLDGESAVAALLEVISHRFHRLYAESIMELRTESRNPPERGYWG